MHRAPSGGYFPPVFRFAGLLIADFLLAGFLLAGFLLAGFLRAAPADGLAASKAVTCSRNAAAHSAAIASNSAISSRVSSAVMRDFAFFAVSGPDALAGEAFLPADFFDGAVFFRGGIAKVYHGCRAA